MPGDYSYEYEWDNEYCYPDSNVLRNKLNITKAEDLSAAEREITSVKLAIAKEILPIKGDFDLAHLQAIHNYLFSDIFEWSGRLRSVNISKGNQFCLVQNIVTYADSIFGSLKAENFLISSEYSVPERLAYYLSEINVLHPFREGNGRTQRLFIEYLASVAGYKVDFSKVSAREMLVVSAESFACNYDSINAMFNRITTPISKNEQLRWIELLFNDSKEALMWAEKNK